MTKIFFPYNDQPKKFSFEFKEPVRFPFYLNDLVYFWEIDSCGITLYLHNQVASAVKDVVLEESGITVYLYNDTAQVGKHIFLDFAKIGSGLYTLGDLDPLTLGDIDAFTLGNISDYASDWMMMKQSIANLNGVVYSEASHTEMQIESDSVLSCIKSVFTGELYDTFGITGLNNQRMLTIGELDQRTIADIDAMMSTFRILEAIPASLVKEIRITQRNMVYNEDAPLILHKETNGSDITMQLGIDIGYHGKVFCNAKSDEVAFVVRSDSVIHCDTDVILQLNTHGIGVTNGAVSLIVSDDEG